MYTYKKSHNIIYALMLAVILVLSFSILFKNIPNISKDFYTKSVVIAGEDLDCNDDLSDAGKQIFCNNASSIPGNKNTLQTVIDNIVNILIGFIGFILAIVILVSAIQIVSSGGSPDAMKSAKNRLAQAAISLGLLISFRAILALLGI